MSRKNLGMKNGTHCCMAALVLALVAGVGQATTLYWGGGTTDIPNGTPIATNAYALNGVWNLTTKNWATDSTGTTYVAWVNDPAAWAYLGPFTNALTTVPVITQAVDVVLNGIIRSPPRGMRYLAR